MVHQTKYILSYFFPCSTHDAVSSTQQQAKRYLFRVDGFNNNNNTDHQKNCVRVDGVWWSNHIHSVVVVVPQMNTIPLNLFHPVHPSTWETTATINDDDNGRSRGTWDLGPQGWDSFDYYRNQEEEKNTHNMAINGHYLVDHLEKEWNWIDGWWSVDICWKGYNFLDTKNPSLSYCPSHSISHNCYVVVVD